MTRKDLERSVKREESLADMYERNGNTLAAQTARKTAQRLRQDIEEAEEEPTIEVEDDEPHAGSRQFFRQAERE